MAKVFKVAKRPEPGWRLHPHSATEPNLAPELVTEYPVGVAVRPKFGKVFAFERLEDARHFQQSRSNCGIYEAQAGKVHPITTRIVTSLSHLGDILNWWKGMFYYGTAEAPKGTVLCDFIILGKEVQ